MKHSLALSLCALLLVVSDLAAAAEADEPKPRPANKSAASGEKLAKTKDRKPRATGLALGQNKATPVERIRAAKGFQSEIV